MEKQTLPKRYIAGIIVILICIILVALLAITPISCTKTNTEHSTWIIEENTLPVWVGETTNKKIILCLYYWFKWWKNRYL